MGGKTTFCHEYKNEMLAGIPNLKWIDIIRDPRAMHASGLTGHYSFSLNRLSQMWWRTYVQTSLAAKARFSQRYLLVRYEDMITQRQQTLERIADFLGLQDFNYVDWERNCDITMSDGRRFGSNSSFNDNNEVIDGRLQSTEGVHFDPRPLARWKTVLSEEQKQLLTLINRRYIGKMGYEDMPIRYTPRLLLQAAAVGACYLAGVSPLSHRTNRVLRRLLALVQNRRDGSD
ncbi:MAG: hypothetical protein A2107_08070 [Verrucomicrobia bacterium GWF2_62_7]|nr:MAG: hypothetical protein A2107_08070 [Verrucomicrobia bacterium GWF2_62_7]